MNPNAANLLDAWERGQGLTSAERALVLLGTVRPEPAEELAQRPLGWVASELLALRASMLGPRLVCLVDCPQCGTVVEGEVAIDQLTAAGVRPLPDRREPRRLHAGQYEVAYRLPTSADLLALRGDPEEAGTALARSLITHASRNGVEVRVAELPPEVHTGLERAIVAEDPLSHIELALVCSACGCRFSEPVQVAEFVWAELSALARRLLLDVARLASVFGWREADILGMSAARRQFYLGLLPA